VSTRRDESEVQRLQQEVQTAILAGRLDEARATLAELIARQQATADTDAVQSAPEASTSRSASVTEESAEPTMSSYPWTTVLDHRGLVVLGAVVGLLIIGRFWQRARSGVRRPRARSRLW
jgi:hypothetical protein